MIIRFITAAVAMLVGIAAAPSQVGRSEERPARLVQVMAARFEPYRPARTLVGTVRARYETDLGFRVAGKIAERRVQIGDRVEPGQVLAVLDATDLELQREQTLAELEAARSAETQAEAEERRVVDLRKRGWSTESIFDRQRAVASEAEGRRKRAERAVALASNALAYATLAADAAGVVTGVIAEPGQVMGTGQPVVRIARVGEREAMVAVPEAEIERTRHGVARVTLWSDPTRSFDARLRELAPSADPLTRTYQARFTVEGLAPDAPLGMTATVTITDPSAEEVVRLPLAALFNQGGGSMVYVVDPAEERLVLKPVKVRAYEGRDVVIGEGLSEGDQVVTLGVHLLEPGLKVRTLGKAS